jgi:3-hydroxyisobutyrate dehydrogenase-like beta-hydroxyacid dehydrogenase
MDVGFVGLGQMGSAMAGRLLDAGNALAVWNRDRSKAAPLTDRGARLAKSPADAARTGIVFTMLANDAALEAVSFGKDGLLTAGRDVLHISSSTVSVALTDRLAEAHKEAGQRFVSAQVLGRPDVAAGGLLSVIAAGTDEDIATCTPLFAAIGQKVLRMGDEPGMAAASKLAANVSIAAVIEMVTEAYTIAGARGVGRQAMLDLFNETNFGSRMITVYGALIAQEKFEPAGFPIMLGRKDVGLGLNAAGADADIPVARLIAERMDRIIAQGGGERDWAASGLPAPKTGNGQTRR